MTDTDRLSTDLCQLGVNNGDTLFIHSSFRSFGTVVGGAGTVVQALEQAVGPSGLLLLPVFNLVKPREKRMSSWHYPTTISTVGWLTEFFRQLPGTYRSNHYSHSVAARGEGAESFVADHCSTKGPVSPWDQPPWGATFGKDSPFQRAYRIDAKLVMIGTDYNTATFIHVIETIWWHHRRSSDTNAPFLGLDRLLVGERWEQIGHIAHGYVGEAHCRLFAIRAFIDTMLAEVTASPEIFQVR